MTSRLDDIKTSSGGADLALGTAELGEAFASILQSLRVFDKALVLESPIVSSRAAAQSWLDISGRARRFPAGGDVTLHLRLFDGPTGERECLTRLEGTRLDDLVTGWLSSFDTDPWEVLTTLAGVKWCVVSSRDFTAEGSRPGVPLPGGWPEDLPLDEVTAGVICRAEIVDYDSDFVSEIGAKLGARLDRVLQKGAALIRLAPPEPVSRPRRNAVPMLRLSPVQASGTIALPGFAATLKGTELLLPLDDDDWTGPQICLPGKVTIPAGQAQSEYDVKAAFDLLSETVTARLTKPPNLRALPGLMDRSELAGPEGFGTALEQVLGRVTAEAWIVLDWSSERTDDSESASVLAIGGAVGFDERAPIELVPRRLTFAPSLTVEVDYPFMATQRELTGRLDGKLTLLDKGQEAASLTGSVEIPEWYFTTTAEVLEVGRLVGALGLDDIALPEALKRASVKLALSGDVTTRSFSVALEFDEGKTWDGATEGKRWALRRLVIGVDYDGEADELTFMVSAKLAFPVLPEGTAGQTFTFDVSGGYEGGWVLRGAMEEGSTLDVSEAINGLLQGLTLPPKMPANLVLSDVAFAAEFSAGNFSVRGRTAKEWTIVGGLTLNVDALEFERSPKKTRATFVVRLSLGTVDLLLEASTPDRDESGWLFKGSSRPGQKIKIAALVTSLCEKLGITQDLPPALTDFAFEDISVSYDTKTSQCDFACTGVLVIDGTEVKSVITVSVTSGDAGKAKLAFTALVHVGGLDFRGAVLADQAAKTTTIVATFQNESKQKISPTTMLGELLQSGSFPDLDVGLQEALFVYHKDTGGTGLLFGVKLDLQTTVSLASVPALAALVGGERIGIEDLSVLLATADFTAERVKTVNQQLPKTFTPLPSGKGEGKDATLGQGAHVSGRLKMGPQAPMPLTLPMGGEAPTARPAAPAAKPGAPAVPAQPTKPAGPEGAKWLEIGKSLGPLRVGRVGLHYAAADKKLGFLLDSSLDLAGLHLGLTGFALYVPLQTGQTPPVTLGLDGLDFAYDGGQVAVAGVFLRRRAEGAPDSYDGLALIKAPKFSISAFGSLTTVAGSTSVFIFGALHGELGGPPAFRLQGLAAGFGYNRRLTLPPIEHVQDFPFVRAAMDASFIPTDQPDKAVSTAMAQVATYVAPSPGDYWLAAGIKFNSFEMVTAVAILSVSFGHDVEIGILGLAEMSLPRGAKGNEIAHVELALRASIRPGDGTVIVEGRLTDASYILSKDCRITGGFAFCAWFSGPHVGDFVVSLGGYHPRFPVPAHYPAVPRLGVHWQVTKSLTITAELYFALTPSCIMAGGRLAAVYESDCIRAWFVISVDFLIHWRPLHYEAGASIRIGLAIDLSFISLQVDLQVSLRMWGPPFSGQLEVDLGVISVSIAFGDQYREPAKLGAKDFREAFLPAADKVLAARVEGGLLRRETPANRTPIHVVTAHEMKLAAESVVPLTAFGGAAKDVRRGTTAALGVRPMALTALASTMSVKIMQTLASDAEQEVTLDNLRIEPIATQVPAALWSPAEHEGVLPPPDMKADGRLGATVGLRLGLDRRPAKGSLPWMDLEKLGRVDLQPKTIPLAAHPPGPMAPITIGKAAITIAEAMSPETQDRRKAVLGVLAAQNWPFPLETVQLERTARQATSCFQVDPHACALGTSDEWARVA